MNRLPIPRVRSGEKTPTVRTQARSATILPSFVGLRFAVHNGKDYVEFTVTEEMVGHKLGEFSMYVSSQVMIGTERKSRC
jgi:ribosomal protein S19